MPLHDRASLSSNTGLSSKAGFFVLLVSFLALALSLSFTRDRLAQELKPGAQPSASGDSFDQ